MATDEWTRWLLTRRDGGNAELRAQTAAALAVFRDEGVEECRKRADGDPRCSFVHAPAEDLSKIPDASVDVVTTRSVLIYCDHKPSVFHEFFRLLRPGGRLSILEPINRFLLEHRPDSLFGLRDPEVGDLLAKVVAVYRDGAGRGENPMTDFDERDLLRWAGDA